MSNPLSARSKSDLADLARRRGVSRWNTLTKEQLVKALSARGKKPAAKPTPRPAKTAAKLTTKPKVVNKAGANGTVRHPAKVTPAAKPVAKMTKPAPAPAAKVEPAPKPPVA